MSKLNYLYGGTYFPVSRCFGYSSGYRLVLGRNQLSASDMRLVEDVFTEKTGIHVPLFDREHHHNDYPYTAYVSPVVPGVHLPELVNFTMAEGIFLELQKMEVIITEDYSWDAFMALDIMMDRFNGSDLLNDDFILFSVTKESTAAADIDPDRLLFTAKTFVILEQSILTDEMVTMLTMRDDFLPAMQVSKFTNHELENYL